MKKKIKEAPKALKVTPNIPIDVLLENCIKGVIHEVAKEHHAEAKEIIRLGSEADRREFLKYYEEDKGNICCLVLDRIKRDLITKGILTAKDEDAFGKPFML